MKIREGKKRSQIEYFFHFIDFVVIQKRIGLMIEVCYDNHLVR